MRPSGAHLHEEGRRRHDLALVRRPGLEVRRPHRGLRRARRGRIRSSASPARSAGPSDAEIAADILALQNDLFIAGAELATAPEAAERLEDGVSRVTAAMVDELEAVIDRYMARVELPPKFVIPGGTPLSAQLDVARATIRARRAPRLGARRSGELAPGELQKLPQPRLRRRLRDRALRRRRRARAVRRTRARAPGRERRPMASRVVAAQASGLHPRRRDRRRSHARHRRAARSRRHRRGAVPDPAPRRRARLVHRDNDRDVRGPQGVGARRRSRSRSSYRSDGRGGANGFEVALRVPGRSSTRSSAGGCWSSPGSAPSTACSPRRPRSRSPSGSGRTSTRADRMDLGLSGRACVVTGASRGIGRATRADARRRGRLRAARRPQRQRPRRRGRGMPRAPPPSSGGQAEALALDITDPGAAERILAGRRGALRQARRARQQRRRPRRWRDLDESPRRIGTRPGSST